jgi:pyruvate/2-oxoglutarate dehydrogenase complex dihydrolipoamide acyltransferase (E2) component
MPIEIRLPQLAKRMTNAVFAQWLVAPGDHIEKDQPICDVTIDKVTLEIDSSIDGYMAQPLAASGQLVPVGGVMALATAAPEEKLSRADIAAYPGFAPAPPVHANCAITPDLGDYIAPSDAMRTVIAQRMSIARAEMPHFYVTTTVDMTSAMELRQKLKSTKQQRIAYNDMLIKASGLALRRYPEVASLYTTQGFVRRNHMHVGFAVSLEPAGLVVPVIADADLKSLHDVSEHAKELARKARNKRLTPDEYGFGVFTVSNLSSYDVEQFTAIINPVNAAILAVGKVQEAPVVRHHEICIRPLMKITLSSDHRVIDGVLAAKFNGYIKHLMENPEMLI